MKKRTTQKFQACVLNAPEQSIMKLDILANIYRGKGRAMLRAIDILWETKEAQDVMRTLNIEAPKELK